LPELNCFEAGALALFAGPIIAREFLTTPRPLRFYVTRAAFATAMFILMWTAWQSLIGWRAVQDFGTLARFGSVLYLLFALLQLTLLLFFAPLSAATAISHEKDRRTFTLLMMTDLSDLEIVLGKLIASFVVILAVLLAGLPVLALCALLGGISFGQVANLFVVTAASGLSGGALGLLIALWRDRTFQSVSLTILMVVLSVVAVEAIAFLFPNLSLVGVPLVEALNPYRATLAVLYPAAEQVSAWRTSSFMYVALRLALAAALIAFGAWKLRKWNPGRSEPREAADETREELLEELEEVAEVSGRDLLSMATKATARSGWAGAASEGGTAGATATLAPPGGEGPELAEPDETRVESAPRTVDARGVKAGRQPQRRAAGSERPYRVPWNNPILWRELMTRAHGTKPLIVKVVYVLIFALGVYAFHALDAGGDINPLGTNLALIPIALGILSLMLVNAQAVTALTSERDSGALDLLLVTELSPSQFILGKLYGALYNTKEMILLPIAWVIWMTVRGNVSVENAMYLIVDFAMLCHFAAMLGLHAGITYTNSRVAVAHSLGTIFFLMAGIGICAFLIILSDREFGRQLLSFMIFIGAGSVALFGSLGARNPSQAIALVAILTPFWTFYCVISLINGEFLAAFLFSMGIYGFFLMAMLVPAVSDFDIALGRTNAIQG
jgi:ABC-type transport system involved in multi-copper enzyme maturation permease subunit